MPHVAPPAHPRTDPVVARARWALLGLFALMGLMVSSWLARLPSVRDALGLSASELGAVLLVGAVGALLAVAAAGVVVARWGGRAALLVSAFGFSLAYVLLGVGAATGSVPVLAAGVFLNGVSFAIGSVPLNIESAGVERRLGRTVLPQFHAAFSIGAVVGSLLGAAMAQLGVGLLAQFVWTAVVALVWRLLSIPHVVLDSLSPRELSARAGAGTATDGGDPSVEGDVVPVRRGSGLRTALGAWRERRTVLVGLVVMSAALSEGSASDWLALAVVDGFAQPESVGAIAFGVFVGAMTVVRILGTRLIDRFGRVAVLRVSGVVSLLGLLAFSLSPSLVVAGLGIAAWGLGAALAVPIGIAAASDDPLRAAGRVSVVSAFASMAHLAAPPLLGLAADTIGARNALLLITGAMVVSILLSGSVARPTTPAPAAGAAVDLTAGQVAVLHASPAEVAVDPLGRTGPVGPGEPAATAPAAMPGPAPAGAPVTAPRPVGAPTALRSPRRTPAVPSGRATRRLRPGRRHADAPGRTERAGRPHRTEHRP